MKTDIDVTKEKVFTPEDVPTLKEFHAIKERNRLNSIRIGHDIRYRLFKRAMQDGIKALLEGSNIIKHYVDCTALTRTLIPRNHTENSRNVYTKKKYVKTLLKYLNNVFKPRGYVVSMHVTEAPSISSNKYKNDFLCGEIILVINENSGWETCL